MIKLSLAKKFGIELVAGDVVSKSHGISTVTMISGLVANHLNDDESENYRDIEEFNTRLISDGIPASIDGDVLLEITNGNGLVLYISARNVAWHVWKTWRPPMEWLVQQAADKPVTYRDDTQHFGEDVQVSADPKAPLIHKAWVALDGELINCENGHLDQSILLIKKDEFYWTTLSKSLSDEAYNDGWKYISTVKEFTDYCECMAAEDKRMDIIGQNGNDGLHYDNAAQQIEALAVNAEPIFTQAMADTGELPPAGIECQIMLDGHWQNCFMVGLSKSGNPVIQMGVHCIESVGCDYKPIDSRTEKQKEVDLALAEYPVADKLTLEFAYDYWLSGRKQ